jgi:membrane-associated protease RseP (regulator of RpoE activity)
MKIHALYVLRTSGIPVYNRSFTEDFKKIDSVLLSSFFGAIFDFSNQVVKHKLQTIEIGNFRFFFWTIDQIIYILIGDPTMSVLLMKDRMKSIREAFDRRINLQECNLGECSIENPDLDAEIDRISSFEDNKNDERINRIRTSFQEEQGKEEMIGGAILSVMGQIYYSSIAINDLHTVLREIEIRNITQSDVTKILHSKSIWQDDEKIIFCSPIFSKILQDMVYIILVFNKNTSLGMADFVLDEMVKKIESLE